MVSAAIPSFFAGIEPIYVLTAICGSMALLIHLVLDYLGFREQPGLGHDLFGRSGMNLIHDTVGFVYPFVVGVMLFGGTGIYGSFMKWGRWETGAAATGIGAGAAAGGEIIRRVLRQVAARGESDRLRVLIGKTGYVTVAVPAEAMGIGKVSLLHHAKETEYSAVTDGPELPIGARVTVSGLTQDYLLQVSLDREQELLRQKYRSEEEKNT